MASSTPPPASPVVSNSPERKRISQEADYSLVAPPEIARLAAGKGQLARPPPLPIANRPYSRVSSQLTLNSDVSTPAFNDSFADFGYQSGASSQTDLSVHNEALAVPPKRLVMGDVDQPINRRHSAQSSLGAEAIDEVPEVVPAGVKRPAVSSPLKSGSTVDDSGYSSGPSSTDESPDASPKVQVADRDQPQSEDIIEPAPLSIPAKGPKPDTESEPETAQGSSDVSVAEKEKPTTLEPAHASDEDAELGIWKRSVRYVKERYRIEDPPLVFPSGPTDEEKLSYLKTNRWPLYSFGVLSFLALSAGMWLFTISSPIFYWFGFFTALIQIYLIISYIVGFCGRDYNYEEHKEILEKYKITPEDCPTVDIYLPCCKEPLEILANTYKYVQEMEYPDMTKKKVYVLDDGGMDEVKELAESFGYNYICRDDRPRLKKAGNLRWAFARTKGDFFVIFDADFCPRADFLTELIPHMRHDPKNAIVQTPQFFRTKEEQTWVEQGAGAIQELFYRLVQVNRNHIAGASICVGSCAVYRREALIETGGTAEIGYSEDVHTGFYAVNRGWKVKYIPLPLACGVCPDTPRAFFSQQMRWCMGSTTLLTNKDFWSSNLTFTQKICYLSGMMYYSATALGIFINPLPGILLMWFRPAFLKYYNLAFAIPSIIYGVVALRIWSKASFSIHVQYIMEIQRYAYLQALLDKMGLTKAMAWVPTGDAKAHKNTKYRNMRILAWCWTIIFEAALISGVTYCILTGWAWYHFVPLIVLNAFNLFISHRFLLAS